jgi:hypothetical protein
MANSKQFVTEVIELQSTLVTFGLLRPSTGKVRITNLFKDECYICLFLNLIEYFKVFRKNSLSVKTLLPSMCVYTALLLLSGY